MKVPQRSPSPTADLGVRYLSWINGELRKEAARREAWAQKEAELRWELQSRLRTVFVAGLSAFSLVVIKLLE